VTAAIVTGSGEEPVTGGEAVVRVLMAAGVETLFGLHGAHVDTIFQSCSDHDVPIVDTRHEVAAGHAAEGYARAGNRLGVAVVTAGPGFTNVITSIANAYLDRTPVLYLSGSAGLAQAETNTLQAGIDQVAIATPITKWAHRVSVAADLPRLVAQAIRVATSEPAGPVLLDLPSDVLNARIAATPVPVNMSVAGGALPPPATIADIAAALRSAERPVILAGAGAYRAGAATELVALAEAAGIPVFTDFAAHGMIPAGHPLDGGTFHKMADLDQEGGRPDLVLAFGVRFGLFTLGASNLIVPQAARLIHVETDARELGLVRTADIALIADPAATMAALRAGLGEVPDRSAWGRAVREMRARRTAALVAESSAHVGRIHPYAAVAAIAEALPENALVVGDGAEAYHWLNETIAQRQPGSYLTHGFLGTVGCGLGLALGAQALDRGRPVLCLVGDGAVGFTIAEFDTMARLDLPIVVVVMNNRSWAASQHFQELAIGPNRVTKTVLGGARYDQVAIGFGCAGVHVETAEALAPAIRDAFAARRPTCINVEIDVGPVPPELHLLMKR
jgi:acetolactate synthase-1/2/3 large subunit